MLKPKENIDLSEFERFGFKKCRGEYGRHGYYLCVSRGCQMIFVSRMIYDINPWSDDDPRIHARANCRYRDQRTALDITYELIKADLLEEVFG